MLPRARIVFFVKFRRSTDKLILNWHLMPLLSYLQNSPKETLLQGELSWLGQFEGTFLSKHSQKSQLLADEDNNS